jgi:hypothetical protein
MSCKNGFYRTLTQLPTPFDVEWFISEIKIRGAVPANMWTYGWLVASVGVEPGYRGKAENR